MTIKEIFEPVRLRSAGESGAVFQHRSRRPMWMVYGPPSAQVPAEQRWLELAQTRRMGEPSDQLGRRIDRRRGRWRWPSDPALIIATHSGHLLSCFSLFFALFLCFFSLSPCPSGSICKDTVSQIIPLWLVSFEGNWFFHPPILTRLVPERFFVFREKCI